MVSPLRLRGAALALALACATGQGASGRLRATDPAQATQGAPDVAHVQVGPAAVAAAIGGWRGQPADLELRLTPVDVAIANAGDRRIRIGPEAFRLVRGGESMRVLSADEVSAALHGLAGFRERPAPRVGAVGGQTFPGYDPGSPYVPGAGPPRFPVPAPGQWYEMQDVSATLEPGRQPALLLFFDTPARSLGNAALEIHLVAEDGTPVGDVRLPFARE